MVNYVKEYYNEIKKGNIVVCNLLKLQLESLIKDMKNPKYVFDEEIGNRPIQFIERYCKHSKGEWARQPIKLELCQEAYLQAKYGFIRADTGLRRFTESFLLMARKNAKSTLSSGEALYQLSYDYESGAEIYAVATKKDQAKIVFNEANRMRSQSPVLAKLLHKTQSAIEFKDTFSKFEALASDSHTLDGLNVHGAFFDELHAVKNRTLYEVIKQGMSARRQPMLTMITTAGTVRESIYDDIYEYAVKVVKGIYEDDSFLAFIYELDKESEWTDPNCWQKANPLLGVSKKWETLEKEVQRAKNDPKYLPGLLCKDFNMRQNGIEAWLPFNVINVESTFDLEMLRNCYAIGGADLSATTDLTCASLIVMRPNDPTLYVLQKYFMPSESIEKRTREDNVPYSTWERQGLIEGSGYNKIDYSDVTQWFIDMFEKYKIRPYWIGYDSWNAGYWVQEMRDYGFNMIEVRQGAKTFSQPMKELEGDFRNGVINYGNNPITKIGRAHV